MSPQDPTEYVGVGICVVLVEKVRVNKIFNEYLLYRMVVVEVFIAHLPHLKLLIKNNF